MQTQGKVFKYPDNVDTDVIIPARYLNTPNAQELALHCMEDIDPAEAVQSADPVEEAAEEINADDEVKVDFDTGVITDITTGKTYKAQPFPPFIQNIIKCGGLLKSLKEGKE